MGNFIDLSSNPIDEDCKSGIGPRGKGDPDDFTLRARELHVNIPKFQEVAAKSVQCKDLVNELKQCAEDNIMFFYNCRHIKQELDKCVQYWKTDLDYREQMIAEYLLVRQEFRKTGRNRLYRALKGKTYVPESQRKGYQI